MAAYWGGDLPWVTISDLNGAVVTETRECITRLGAEHSRARLLKAGTLLFSFKLTIGKVAMAGMDLYTNEAIAGLIPRRDDEVDRDYLRFALASVDVGAGSSHAVKGRTLNQETLAALEIPIPSISEQRRIATALADELATVERARAAAEAQLEAAKAFSVEWVRLVFQQREQGGSRRVSLRELSNAPSAFSDGPFGSNLKTEHYTSTGARVVRLQNIGRGEFLDADKAYVSLEHFAHLERHHVQSGDVVVAALGDGARPAGRACIIPNDFGPGLVKADCFRVRLPQDVILPEYLVAYLNSPDPLRRVSELMRGATRPRVNLEMLRQLVVPVPSLAVQRELLAALHGRSARAIMLQAAGEHQLRAIAALPAALLRRAFSGEL